MQTPSSGPRNGAHVVLLIDAPAIAVETRIGFASPGHSGGAAAVNAGFGMRYAFGRFRARGNHLLFFECRAAAAARHPGPFNLEAAAAFGGIRRTSRAFLLRKLCRARNENLCLEAHSPDSAHCARPIRRKTQPAHCLKDADTRPSEE
jgi:hypothetical protein